MTFKILLYFLLEILSALKLLKHRCAQDIFLGWMGGWVDGWWMGGWMDGGWMDGWMGG